MAKDAKGQSASKRGLTDKQKRFVDEYLIDLNATQAAIRAGYSSNRASEIGYQLLQKTTVQQAIAERRNDRAEKTLITQEMVIKGLLTEATTTEEGASHSARVSAWGLLGKHLGMFKDKVELTGANGAPLPVNINVVFSNEPDD